jgi:phage-related tail protein
MGKFSNDTSFITKLSNEFDEVNTKLMEIGKSIDELNKKYENPEM